MVSDQTCSKQENSARRQNVAAEIPLKLSPPTPFADNAEFLAATLPHLKPNLVRTTSSAETSQQPPPVSKTRSIDNPIFDAGRQREATSTRGSRTLPRKSKSGGGGSSAGGKRQSSQETIPPPPQYKGVHFAPGVLQRDKKSTSPPPIPTEGLPNRPAGMGPKGAKGRDDNSMVLIPQAQTVPITVRGSAPLPLLKSRGGQMSAGGMASSQRSSSSFGHQANAPQKLNNN